MADYKGKMRFARYILRSKPLITAASHRATVEKRIRYPQAWAKHIEPLCRRAARVVYEGYLLGG
jgi:hypothetical protein